MVHKKSGSHLLDAFSNVNKKHSESAHRSHTWHMKQLVIFVREEKRLFSRMSRLFHAPKSMYDLS